MKKKILSMALLLTLLFTGCMEKDESKGKSEESSGVISESALSSSDASENVFEEISDISEESVETESDENSHVSDISEVSELPEVSEVSEVSETSEISADASETSETTETSEISEISAISEESSIPDSSYEVMDTPVIPVPEKLAQATEDAFFNDSVFVGNSIMLGYQKFTNKQRAGSIPDFLGNSKFFVAGSFGVYHNNRTPASKKNSSNPSYEGVKYSVEDAVGVMGVKTVYINFMGLNDLSLYYDPENCSRKCADDVIKLIKTINERYPDVNVVILSATYLTASTNNRPSLNNKNLSMLNNYLLEYCNENGLDFVDIASQLTEKGCLADSYASDGYCHIWTKGYMVWTAILRDYAARKIEGTYQNPERMPLLGINK